MLKKKGFKVLMLLAVMLLMLGCQQSNENLVPPEPLQPVEGAGNTQPAEPVAVEEEVLSKIEPVVLDSEGAVLEQLRKVLRE